MAIETVVEEVADNLEELAVVTRRINPRSVGFFIGGIAVGAAVGFYFGYRFNKEKLRAEAFADSAEELEKIREHYQQRVVAATPKPSVEEIVEEKGYDVVEERRYSTQRPLPAPVPIRIEPTPGVAPPVVTYDGGKDKNLNWNYGRELNTRTPETPYIIHQDEYDQNETEYTKVTYVYYVEDDVLVDEENNPLRVDLIIGEENLRFGHGSDDIDVVHIRNDRLELDIQLHRSSESFEEKVLGLENSEIDDSALPS